MNHSPLWKRLKRELIGDIGKYLVIFIFVAGTIAMVSGFLVADDSMIAAYQEGFDKYAIEDGNFELATEADSQLINRLEQEGVDIYPNYYLEKATKPIDSTLRVFVNREKVNKICVMDGKLPSNQQEVAIDRMYADNNELEIGNSLTIGGQSFKICGLVAFSDYSTLFSNNSDMIFDAMKFGAAVTTKEGFNLLEQENLHYSYSWVYHQKPKTDEEKKDRAESFLKVLSSQAQVTNYIPQYINQAIHFAGDDLGRDKAIFITLLYLVIIIIAFVFAITTTNTISKESSVIGTLRASGYTKGELVRHYLAMPMIVVIVAAILGNIFGYTLLKSVFANMYYGSYSLPTYVTRWNAEAFLLTTVIPIIIMFIINLIILVVKLSLPVLKFLRHDLRRRQKKKAFKLNTKLRIFTRFRLRIIFQNLPNYITLFIGITLASIILLFGVALKPMLAKYQDDICNNIISEYQYILKSPEKTSVTGVDSFSVTSLKTQEGRLKSEEISVYGINKNSPYVDIDCNDDEVYVSDGYAEKHKLSIGDQITLKEVYGDQTYSFKVKGIYTYPSTLAIFGDRESLNEKFSNDKQYFNGYFSHKEIKDIDSMFIATTVTQDDLTKVCRQMDLSMGDLMSLVVGFSIIMFILLIYLLCKLIIERNAQSISMTKILGYRDGEIARLYILSSTIVVVISLVVGLWISNAIMKQLFVMVFSDFQGWLPYYMTPGTLVKMFGLGFACYLFVAVLQMLKIKRIPKSDALKNVE